MNWLIFIVCAILLATYIKLVWREWNPALFLQTLFLLIIFNQFSWVELKWNANVLSIPVGIPLFILFILQNKSDLHEFYFRTNFINRGIFWGCLYGVAIAAISISVVSPNRVSNSIVDPILFQYVIRAIEVAIGEELFFRGAVMGTLIHKGQDPKIAIGIQGILFSIAHLSKPLNQFFIPVLFGFVIGFVVMKYKNIYAGIIGHALSNILPRIV